MPNTASPDTDSSKTNAAGVRSERSVIGTPQVILVIMGVYAAYVNHFKHHRLVTTDLKGTHWSSVVYENEPAMRGLVAHMLDNTSDNNIAFLSGFTSSTNSIERERAFRSVMSERGRQVDESLMLCADYSAAKSFLVIDKLLSSGRCPSAIIAANDAMALGAIESFCRTTDR